MRTPGRHVDERATRPDRRVERRELVVVRRDDRAHVLLDDVLVLTERRVHVEEDDALALEILLQLVVDDLGLVLGADAGEVLLLRLRDAELVPGVEDLGRQVLPLVDLLLGRLDVVVDVLEVDLGDVAAPGRQRSRVEVVERLVPERAHPVGLVLVLGDRLDDLVREAAAGLEEVVLRLVRVREPVLVLAPNALDDVVLGGAHAPSPPSPAGPTPAGMKAS